MRRRLIHLCIVAALALSGWGGTFAAAMCAHARTGAHDGHCLGQRRAAVAADHRVSHPDRHARTQTDAAGDHCRHKPRAAAPNTSAAAPETSASAPGRAVAALGPGVGSSRGRGRTCTHCLSNPGGTTSTAAVSEQARRGKFQQTAAPVESLAGAHDMAFAPPVTPKQGSPPGPASRRHLVLSVFLI